jgi:uracil-DNA glycosylase family 4
MQPRADQSIRRALQSVAMDRYFGLDAVPIRRDPHAAMVVVDVELDAGREAPPTPPARSAAGELRRVTVAAPEVSPSFEMPHAAPARSSEPASAQRTVIPTLRGRRDVRSLDSLAERAEALATLQERHAQECPHCTVATSHTNLVFGEGSPVARLMFVGEAPGETEDQLGRPFVGKAGQKLDEMIKAMGMARTDVYIANVLKSRPPENRTPLQHEVDACGPYLVEQLRIIRPAVVVSLGGPATKLLLATELGITRLRGVWAAFRMSLAASDEASAPEDLIEVPVMPTFHPAYLLRNYTAETRRQVWTDLQAALAKLRSAGT